ncbi:aminodeoxychorismate lyase [Bacillus carboniphilus]|uniref:aminodeoxychorismate lyase n=1 Tax=Bacillus carboniphilus TaxID=86663 RepID=A0ABN0WA29_9BACI
MFIYINGKIVHKDEVTISPFDHGFLYGLGVFETFRTYEGKPFLFNEHWDRLQQGLTELNIHLKFSKEEIFHAVQTLCSKNQWPESRLRLNISAGVGDVGLQTSPYLDPNVLIFQSPLPETKVKQVKKLKVLKRTRNTPEGEFRLKSHHYLNNILAKREIGDNPALEGLFLTTEGYVAEGIVSNVFWVKSGELFTPTVKTGILNGITRQFVMKLANYLGIGVHEGFYEMSDLLSADEVFVTNSIQEIVPIDAVQGEKEYGGFTPITYRLDKAYQVCIFGEKAGRPVRF